MKREKLKYWLDFNLALTSKEIKARYKHAILGFLWIFLNPVLQMLMIGYVFQFFVPVRVDNYFLFLFSGLLPWNFFSMSISKTTPMFFYERSLIQKAKFPREAIVLSIVFSNLFHLIISVLLLLIFILFSGNIFWAGLLWIPVIFVWLTALTCSLSLLFASLNVRFRDINFAVQAVMPLWFYATPLIYGISLIPKDLHFLFYLNPMTPLVELMRFAVLGLPIESPTLFLPGGIITLLLIVLSIKVFQKESPYFDDWL